MKFLELAEQVLAQRERDGIRGLDRELSRYRCHIATAAFADVEISDIAPPAIREWLREMTQKQTAGHGTPRKLSRQTISRCLSLVSAVFVEAVERELIETNPCIGVKPKKRVDESDTVEKWAYLTLDDQKAIAACGMIPRADRLMIAFAIATGLRQGEQHHLEIKDLVVDGDDPHVLVRYGSRSKAGAKLPPKSGKKRKVPLTPIGVGVSREWLGLLPAYAPENPLGVVFPSPNGRLRHQGKPLGTTGALKRHLASAGITRRVRWHDLRHTCATNLITGVLGRQWTLAEVQRVMGHSSSAVTERYSHMSDDVIADAARATIATESGPVLLVEGPEQVASFVERIAVRARRVVRGFVARLEEARHAG